MNRKKIAAIVVFGLTMTTCSTPAVGQATKEDVINYTSEYNKQSILDLFEAQEAKQTQLEEEAEAARKLEADTALVNKALKKLNSYVNKTWYVFSGSTPSCLAQSSEYDISESIQAHSFPSACARAII